MIRKGKNTLLNPKRLGLAAAIVWSLSVFTVTLYSVVTGYGTGALNIYASLHPGYSISVAGAFVGLIYSFICAFIWVYITVWLYNWLEKKKI